MNARRVVNGINTVVIYNKDYVEVVERLRILHELKKEFEVVESQPLQASDRWLWKVVILVDGKRYVGNAEVKLSNAKPGSPDASNPFECAETSALGRCLAFAGLGTLESIASYDEIARGQTVTTIVEANGQTSYNRPQIASPSSDSEESTISQKTATRGPGKLPVTSGEAVNGKNGQHPLSARLNAVYVAARDAKRFTPKKGSEQADFLAWVREVFPEQSVQTSTDVSVEMIEYLEEYLKGSEAAHV